MDNPEIENDSVNREDVLTTDEEEIQTETAQNSSGTSNSVQRTNPKVAKHVGLEHSRRPSTRSQGGEKRAD